MEKYGGYPPGHFFSPIPDLEYLEKNIDAFYKTASTGGIDLREYYQLSLLHDTPLPMYKDFNFPVTKEAQYRYYFQNEAFQYNDAYSLWSMIHHIKPKKIIEIGSGFSSALMLDTNEIWFDNNISLTFIEPFSKVFKEVARKDDCYSLIEKPVQEVDLSLFQKLEENDLLFIDSTHVSKVFSDVNYEIFNILPSLKKGVYIHFHDIFFPFEYPIQWTRKGWFWNEAFLLKAFLQYNDSFQIELFNSFLANTCPAMYGDYPLCSKNFGASIYLKKIK